MQVLHRISPKETAVYCSLQQSSLIQAICCFEHHPLCSIFGLEMPIVDNELVATIDDLPFPPVSAGHYLREVIKKNVENLGDSMWMVCCSFN